MIVRTFGRLLPLLVCACPTYAIEPLTEDDMSQVDGQISPLPAFMRTDMAATPTINIRESKDTTPPNNAMSAPSGNTQSENDTTDTNNIQVLEVVVKSDGGVTLDVSGFNPDASNVELSVAEAADTGLGAITGAFDISMSAIKLNGISDQSSVNINADANGYISTSVRGVVQNMTIDRMSFGEQSLLNGYEMHDVQFQGLDATVTLRQ